MSFNFPHANFTPQLIGYTGQGTFRFWCQKVLPIVYDDSLSYYELLNKVVNYLNNAIKDISVLAENNTGLYNAFVALQNYVNNYFDSLDVTEAIDDKLDRMAESGELTQIFFSWASLGYLNFVTPELFGATGDGITDDSKPFNDMFAYLDNNGGTALLGGKTYLFNTPVRATGVQRKSFSVVGCGASSVLKRSETCVHVLILDNLDGCTFNGFNVDANAGVVGVPSNVHGGIYVTDSKNLTFRNILVYNFEYCGFISYVRDSSLDAGFISENIELIDCKFDGTLNFNPTICDGVKNVYHSGSIITSCNNAKYIRCEAINCNSYGLEFKGKLTEHTRTSIKGEKYIDCVCTNCYRGGPYFGGEDKLSRFDVSFHENSLCSNFTCLNCFSCCEIGFANGVVIDNFCIYFDTSYPFSSYLHFIRLRGCNDVKIGVSVLGGDLSSNLFVCRATEGTNNVMVILLKDDFETEKRGFEYDTTVSNLFLIRLSNFNAPMRKINDSSAIQRRIGILDVADPLFSNARGIGVSLSDGTTSAMTSSFRGLSIIGENGSIGFSRGNSGRSLLMSLSAGLDGSQIGLGDDIRFYLVDHGTPDIVAVIDDSGFAPSGNKNLGSYTGKWNYVWCRRVDVDNGEGEAIIDLHGTNPKIRNVTDGNGVALRLDSNIGFYNVTGGGYVERFMILENAARPGTNGEYDLGTPSARFKMVHTDGISIGGVTLNSDELRALKQLLV